MKKIASCFLAAVMMIAAVMCCIVGCAATPDANKNAEPTPTDEVIPVFRPNQTATQATQAPSPTPTQEPTQEPTATPMPTNPPVNAYSDGDKLIALTFDDGPAASTEIILNVLEQYSAHATFFVVGDRLENFASSVKRADALGCEIGNHTWDHKKKLTDLDRQGWHDEINAVDDKLMSLIDKKTTFVRPPGGSYNATVLEISDRALVRWSIDTLDWKTRNTQSIISEVKGKVRDGDIILMHDLYGTTAEAVKEVVPYLVNEGYKLVTISELMQARGIELARGTVHFNGYRAK